MIPIWKSFYIIVERDVGLFSLVQQAITNIARALQEKRIPIVYFSHRTAYWTPNGYRDRDTVWEYYFEPIIPEYPASFVSSDLRKYIDDNFPKYDSGGYFADEFNFVSNNYGEHPSFGGDARLIPFKSDDPDAALRRWASAIIRQYVRPRRDIFEIAEAFFADRMRGKFNIGLHLRGTDALVEGKRAQRGQILDFLRYRECVNNLLRTYPEAGLFVASDAESSVMRMREMFGNRVIATTAYRHQGGEMAGSGPTGWIMPAYLVKDRDLTARSGEEAVIDYLLLSRCNWLIHNGSSLARTVLLNVPEMPVSSTVVPPVCPG